MYRDPFVQSSGVVSESNWLFRVFGWMSVALSISALTAYWVASTPIVIKMVIGNPVIMIVLFLAQLGLVISLSGFISRINYGTALVLFGIYSVLMGLTLSTVFLIYTSSSIFTTFFVAAGMFASMAFYGYFTRADLTSIGSFGFMALIGLIIGSFVNFFFKSELFSYILSFVGVVIFTLLTAYDVQKMKHIFYSLNTDRQSINKIAITCALTLYLDFINLFLYLLNVMGRRRD